MKEIVEKIKKYPVSVMYIIVIWVLCFMDVPETPLSNVTMIDKWTHIAMYLGTCLTIWFEYGRNHKGVFSYKGVRVLREKDKPQWLRLFVGAWLAPVVMSGVIELGQAYCTGGRRSGEWLDFFANSIGCTFAAVIGIAYYRLKAVGGNRWGFYSFFGT